MHVIYGFYNGNATSAVEEYQRRFLGQTVPNKRPFMAVDRHLRKTGLFPSTFSSERPRRQDEETLLL
jgi:hypothetical protein